MAHSFDPRFVPLSIAVLTVSDTRTFDTDTSGQTLVDALQHAGHQLADRRLVIDDVYHLRAVVSQWIVDPQVQVILLTGGTGFTVRDNTPQAIAPLFDRTMDGFGELFRSLSLADIGTSTIQSRALAGFANGTLICCLPGSPGACRLAWDQILLEQLDSRTRPCNAVPHLKKRPREPGAATGCGGDQCACGSRG
ncbi:molybdenum cofactor biosynthesis protein B [Halopseudomonas nanhaiensis]|uniref:molybdenum cofactor biosynthesis protein B n=1 Tax=Halopseudomonas nanhaiensis TaxID=2830842 RepID=UPI001CBFE29C|nr:molybdenum cofactor biosynthesis protein B [Halopseudomonas nanhaiensis]UAW99334.1 molybdenum cofactor biosynthesis protein B [Halopseudomonas nanhaiensis]